MFWIKVPLCSPNNCFECWDYSAPAQPTGSVVFYSLNEISVGEEDVVLATSRALGVRKDAFPVIGSGSSL